MGCVLHHNALGIHPGAFVQDSAPDTAEVQDGVLWVDTSSGPPYQLKVWDLGAATWHLVGIVGSAVGVDSGGNLATDCLVFPRDASICNPENGLVEVHTPASTHGFDGAGYTLPGSHRLERVL